MSLLPNLLYLYRVLPIAIPSYFHRDIQTRVFKYMWASIKPRLSRAILLRSKLSGGLGLPNFACYYHAAQLAQITLLHAKTEIPLWVSLKAIELSPLIVTNLLWLPPSTRGLITNPVTRHSLRLWDSLRGPFKLTSPHSPLLSFLGHPLFYPAFTEPGSFWLWSQAGLSRICHLVTDTTIKFFPALQSQADLPPNECFRYFQIAHFVQTIIGSCSPVDGLSIYEGICDSDPHAPGIISRLYNHLTSPPVNLPSYTAQWSTDLQIEHDAEDWVDIWTNTKSSSHNIVALEANYKVLMSWYLVPARVSKFLPNYSPMCFRGCGERGTHVHIWWSCPIVKQFWTIIFHMASTLPWPIFDTTKSCAGRLNKSTILPSSPAYYSS